MVSNRVGNNARRFTAQLFVVRGQKYKHGYLEFPEIFLNTVLRIWLRPFGPALRAIYIIQFPCKNHFETSPPIAAVRVKFRAVSFSLVS
jgi:hypothetical protein